MPISVDISPGELIDRISILEIKRAHLADDRAREAVGHQLEALELALQSGVTLTDELREHVEALRAINRSLWALEDEIRILEGRADHGARFVEVSREILRQNDLRAQTKHRINRALGSRIVEEKAYAS